MILAERYEKLNEYRFLILDFNICMGYYTVKENYWITLMQQNVILKKNILYFELGILRVGDIDNIIDQTMEIIDRLESPFYSISILDHMVESHSLIHPEDFEKFKSFGALLNEKGRALSVWVVPESSILYHTSLMTIPPNGKVNRVDSIEEAEKLIEEYRFSKALG